jgi:hypothetical protein
MKSYTGGFMSLDRGIIYGTSKRHKLNMKSSTESELVCADDVIPQMLSTLNLLQDQGYKIGDNFLYQDNKSSILLETNGWVSSGKRPRHIAVQYFFIAHRVKFCPTGILIGDFLQSHCRE